MKIAKTAKTFFRVVKRFEKFSLVSLVIETGKNTSDSFSYVFDWLSAFRGFLFTGMVRKWGFSEQHCMRID